MEKASVSVKIYNSTYALTTSASEEQVLKIAAEVDRRMQELAESKNCCRQIKSPSGRRLTWLQTDWSCRKNALL